MQAACVCRGGLGTFECRQPSDKVAKDAREQRAEGVVCTRAKRFCHRGGVLVGRGIDQRDDVFDFRWVGFVFPCSRRAVRWLDVASSVSWLGSALAMSERKRPNEAVLLIRGVV